MHALLLFFAFSASSVSVPRVDAYRDLVVKDGFETDPLRLAQGIGERMGAIEPETAWNAGVASDPRFVELRKAEGLDLLLLDKLYEMDPDGMKNTAEFSAYVGMLEGQWAVVWARGDLPGSAPGADELASAVEDLRAKGGRILYHVHNHPFLFGSGDWHGGTVVPSTGDIGVWNSSAEKFGIQEARITNGFTTLVVPSSSFPSFR